MMEVASVSASHPNTTTANDGAAPATAAVVATPLHVESHSEFHDNNDTNNKSHHDRASNVGNTCITTTTNNKGCDDDALLSSSLSLLEERRRLFRALAMAAALQSNHHHYSNSHRPSNTIHAIGEGTDTSNHNNASPSSPSSFSHQYRMHGSRSRSSSEALPVDAMVQQQQQRRRLSSDGAAAAEEGDGAAPSSPSVVAFVIPPAHSAFFDQVTREVMVDPVRLILRGGGVGGVVGGVGGDDAHAPRSSSASRGDGRNNAANSNSNSNTSTRQHSLVAVAGGPCAAILPAPHHATNAGRDCDEVAWSVDRPTAVAMSSYILSAAASSSATDGSGDSTAAVPTIMIVSNSSLARRIHSWGVRTLRAVADGMAMVPSDGDLDLPLVARADGADGADGGVSSHHESTLVALLASLQRSGARTKKKSDDGTTNDDDNHETDTVVSPAVLDGVLMEWDSDPVAALLREQYAAEDAMVDDDDEDEYEGDGSDNDHSGIVDGITPSSIAYSTPPSHSVSGRSKKASSSGKKGRRKRRASSSTGVGGSGPFASIPSPSSFYHYHQQTAAASHHLHHASTSSPQPPPLPTFLLNFAFTVTKDDIDRDAAARHEKAMLEEREHDARVAVEKAYFKSLYLLEKEDGETIRELRTAKASQYLQKKRQREAAAAARHLANLAGGTNLAAAAAKATAPLPLPSKSPPLLPAAATCVVSGNVLRESAIRDVSSASQRADRQDRLPPPPSLNPLPLSSNATTVDEEAGEGRGGVSGGEDASTPPTRSTTTPRSPPRRSVSPHHTRGGGGGGAVHQLSRPRPAPMVPATLPASAGNFISSELPLSARLYQPSPRKDVGMSANHHHSSASAGNGGVVVGHMSNNNTASVVVTNSSSLLQQGRRNQQYASSNGYLSIGGGAHHGSSGIGVDDDALVAGIGSGGGDSDCGDGDDTDEGPLVVTPRHHNQHQPSSSPSSRHGTGNAAAAVGGQRVGSQPPDRWSRSNRQQRSSFSVSTPILPRGGGAGATIGGVHVSTQQITLPGGGGSSRHRQHRGENDGTAAASTGPIPMSSLRSIGMPQQLRNYRDVRREQQEARQQQRLGNSGGAGDNNNAVAATSHPPHQRGVAGPRAIGGTAMPIHHASPSSPPPSHHHGGITAIVERVRAAHPSSSSDANANDDNNTINPIGSDGHITLVSATTASATNTNNTINSMHAADKDARYKAWLSHQVRMYFITMAQRNAINTNANANAGNSSGNSGRGRSGSGGRRTSAAGGVEPAAPPRPPSSAPRRSSPPTVSSAAAAVVAEEGEGRRIVLSHAPKPPKFSRPPSGGALSGNAVASGGEHRVTSPTAAAAVHVGGSAPHSRPPSSSHNQQRRPHSGGAVLSLSSRPISAYNGQSPADYYANLAKERRMKREEGATAAAAAAAEGGAKGSDANDENGNERGDKYSSGGECGDAVPTRRVDSNASSASSARLAATGPTLPSSLSSSALLAAGVRPTTTAATTTSTLPLRNSNRPFVSSSSSPRAPPPPTVSVMTGPFTDARGAAIDPSTVIATSKRQFRTFTAPGVGPVKGVRDHNKPSYDALAMRGGGGSGKTPQSSRGVGKGAPPLDADADVMSGTVDGQQQRLTTQSARRPPNPPPPPPPLSGAAHGATDTPLFKRRQTRSDVTGTITMTTPPSWLSTGSSPSSPNRGHRSASFIKTLVAPFAPHGGASVAKAYRAKEERERDAEENQHRLATTTTAGSRGRQTAAGGAEGHPNSKLHGSDPGDANTNPNTNTTNANTAVLALKDDMDDATRLMLKNILPDSNARWRAKMRRVYGVIGEDSDDEEALLVLKEALGRQARRREREEARAERHRVREMARRMKKRRQHFQEKKRREQQQQQQQQQQLLQSQSADADAGALATPQSQGGGAVMNMNIEGIVTVEERRASDHDGDSEDTDDDYSTESSTDDDGSTDGRRGKKSAGLADLDVNQRHQGQREVRIPLPSQSFTISKGISFTASPAAARNSGGGGEKGGKDGSIASRLQLQKVRRPLSAKTLAAMRKRDTLRAIAAAKAAVVKARADRVAFYEQMVIANDAERRRDGVGVHTATTTTGTHTGSGSSNFALGSSDGLVRDADDADVHTVDVGGDDERLHYAQRLEAEERWWLGQLAALLDEVDNNHNTNDKNTSPPSSPRNAVGDAEDLPRGSASSSRRGSGRAAPTASVLLASPYASARGLRSVRSKMVVSMLVDEAKGDAFDDGAPTSSSSPPPPSPPRPPSTTTTLTAAQRPPSLSPSSSPRISTTREASVASSSSSASPPSPSQRGKQQQKRTSHHDHEHRSRGGLPSSYSDAPRTSSDGNRHGPLHYKNSPAYLEKQRAQQERKRGRMQQQQQAGGKDLRYTSDAPSPSSAPLLPSSSSSSSLSFEERLLQHIAWRQGTVYGRLFVKMREQLGGGKLDHRHPLLRKFQRRQRLLRQAEEEEEQRQQLKRMVKGLLLKHKAEDGRSDTFMREEGVGGRGGGGAYMYDECDDEGGLVGAIRGGDGDGDAAADYYDDYGDSDDGGEEDNALYSPSATVNAGARGGGAYRPQQQQRKGTATSSADLPHHHTLLYSNATFGEKGGISTSAGLFASAMSASVGSGVGDGLATEGASSSAALLFGANNCHRGGGGGGRTGKDGMPFVIPRKMVGSVDHHHGGALIGAGDYDAGGSDEEDGGGGGIDIEYYNTRGAGVVPPNEMGSVGVPHTSSFDQLLATAAVNAYHLKHSSSLAMQKQQQQLQQVGSGPAFNADVGASTTTTDLELPITILHKQQQALEGRMLMERFVIDLARRQRHGGYFFNPETEEEYQTRLSETVKRGLREAALAIIETHSGGGGGDYGYGGGHNGGGGGAAGISISALLQKAGGTINTTVGGLAVPPPTASAATATATSRQPAAQKRNTAKKKRRQQRGNLAAYLGLGGVGGDGGVDDGYSSGDDGGEEGGALHSEDDDPSDRRNVAKRTTNKKRNTNPNGVPIANNTATTAHMWDHLKLDDLVLPKWLDEALMLMPSDVDVTSGASRGAREALRFEMEVGRGRLANRAKEGEHKRHTIVRGVGSGGGGGGDKTGDGKSPALHQPPPPPPRPPYLNVGHPLAPAHLRPFDAITSALACPPPTGELGASMPRMGEVLVRQRKEGGTAMAPAQQHHMGAMSGAGVLEAKETMRMIGVRGDGAGGACHHAGAVAWGASPTTAALQPPRARKARELLEEGKPLSASVLPPHPPPRAVGVLGGHTLLAQTVPLRGAGGGGSGSGQHRTSAAPVFSLSSTSPRVAAGDGTIGGSTSPRTVTTPRGGGGAAPHPLPPPPPAFVESRRVSNGLKKQIFVHRYRGVLDASAPVLPPLN